MATIANLVAKVGVDNSGLVYGLNKAGGLIKGFSSTIKSGFSSLGNMANGIGSAIAGVGAGPLALVAGAAATLSTGLYASVQAARDARSEEIKLGAVVKATGGAAGLTAGEMSDFADSLERVTNFDADELRGAEAVLATFKEVKGDVFLGAVEAMTDMSAVMGGDVQSAALQLGKALNDPVEGLSALSRVGVSFTNDQRRMIKEMVAAGNIAGAQKIILAELKSEFGGVAQSMADPWVRVQRSVGNLMETIGTKFLPLVDMMATSLAETLDGLGQDLEAPGWIESAIGAIATVTDMIHISGLALKVALTAAVTALAEGITRVVELAAKLPSLANFLGVLGPGGSALSAAMSATGTNLDELATTMRDGTEEIKQSGLQAIDDLNAGLATKTPMERLQQMAQAAGHVAANSRAAAGGLKGMSEAAEKANQSADDLVKSLQFDLDTFGLADVAKKLDQLANAGADDATLAKAWDLSEKLGLKEATAEAAKLQEELDFEKFGLTDFEQKLRKLREAGVDQGTLDQIGKDREYLDAAAKAATIREQYATPLDKYLQKMEELDQLMQMGVLDAASAGRAGLAAQKELLDGTASKPLELPAALARGSAGAYSAIVRAQSPNRGPDTQAKMLAEAQRQTKHLANIAAAMGKGEAAEFTVVEPPPA